MASKYFILEIKGVYDSRFGDCVVVYANPLQKIGMGLSYTPYINEDTVAFFFPDDDSIIQPIVRSARAQQPFEPDFDYFKEETIFNENTRKRMPIFRHLSFYDKSHTIVGNTKPLRISPVKVNILNSQYSDYMRQNYQWDPIDLQVYVGRLAENDSNFFAWLFDDSSLRGCQEWELDDEYREAWDNFYERCDPYFSEPNGDDNDDEDDDYFDMASEDEDGNQNNKSDEDDFDLPF